MSALRNRIDQIRMSFARLSQREQTLVIAAAGVFGLVVLIGIGLLVSNAISKAEHRVKTKTAQLNKVLLLQGEYKARLQEQKDRIRKLKGRSNIRLVKLVEDAARGAGIEIGQLRPEEGQPNAEGIVESRVDLRASNLSVDRLQDFLSRVEKSPGVVIIQRLKVNKPYRKETLDIDITVTTYRAKS